MEKLTMNAEEVMEALGCSQNYAYTLIRKLNAEMEKEGYMVFRGHVNREFFLKKMKYKAD
ncbi:MAG: DNA-binding protein [Hespellia sp.]|nr:DNA-binding protein [Hespellia sp.]